MVVRIIIGDCREVLRALPDESVHCVVTSPPYWGLRDYGVAGQIGLEATFETFTAEMVTVFREVRRVLRADGTCWVNLGDSYNTGTTSGRKATTAGKHGYWENPSIAQRINANQMGLKPKDLVGIPWRVAFALQADGWFLRQDIIWSKPNPMPESVTDRCTKSHEYIFLLSKSGRYHFDQAAILEDASPSTHARLAQDVQAQVGSDRAHAGGKTNGRMKAVGRLTGTPHGRHTLGDAIPEGERRKLAEPGSGVKNNGSFDAAMAIMPVRRNKRSVWTVVTEGFSEAHFATFPPALIEPCILSGCPAGGIVLDPFGGAGTTGLVADRLGRNAILIELNPEYAAMAERRIKGDSALFADVRRESAEANTP
jgi:DNA modification methylase